MLKKKKEEKNYRYDNKNDYYAELSRFVSGAGSEKEYEELMEEFLRFVDDVDK